MQMSTTPKEDLSKEVLTSKGMWLKGSTLLRLLVKFPPEFRSDSMISLQRTRSTYKSMSQLSKHYLDFVNHCSSFCCVRSKVRPSVRE